MDMNTQANTEPEIHPYNSDPIPADTEILIVGTAPPRRFFNSSEWDREKDTPFYYGSRDNQLWKDILSPIAQDMKFEDLLKGTSDERAAQMKTFLRGQKIWMQDVLETCPRKGSSDQDRHIDFLTARFSDFEFILENYNIEKIVFTGKEPAFWFFCKGLARDEKQRVINERIYRELDARRQKINDLDIQKKFVEPFPWPNRANDRTIKFYIAPSPSRSYRIIDKFKKREAYRAILFPAS